eukprot:UN04327
MSRGIEELWRIGLRVVESKSCEESAYESLESNHESWNRFVTKITWDLFILQFLKNGHFQNRLHESTTPKY